MTENFAERFIDHRHIGLAPQTVSELGFIMLNVDSTLERLW